MRTEEATPKPVHGLPLNPRLAEEIDRALEMMRRVRTAQAAQEKGEVLETPGNKYELPKPPVLRVSTSSEGD
jgi:hypothetical protein